MSLVQRILRKIGPPSDIEHGSRPITAFSNLKKGDIAIDCGANVGTVTRMMARKGVVVYAFEPNPFAFKILRRRFRRKSKVHCINKGVWDRETVIPLYSHERSDEDEVYWSTGSSILDFKGNIKKDKFVMIETVDLATFISQLGSRIALCKLDVEGVEVEIINNLIDTKAIDHIDLLLVETHDHKIPKLKESTDLLRERIRKRGIKNINLNWI